MNKHHTQSVLKLFLLIVTALSSGCGQSTIIDSPTLTPVPSQTSTEIAKTTPTLSVTTTLIPTPTARVFKQANDCNSLKDSGHIFFFRGDNAGKRNYASHYDLYVMDGNGCSLKFVMSEVSGSPAWSMDSKRLAVGCENNSFLCILDIDTTLNTCTGLEKEIGECHPAILQKIDLPSKVANDKQMYNTAWSSDDSEVAVEGGTQTSQQRQVYIFSLIDQTWRIYLQGAGTFDIAWAPKDNQIVISGLTFININNDKIEASIGLNPEWSPDGERIAFVVNSLDDTKESYGIASIDFQSGNWKWLYEPILRDKYYYPPHMLVIIDDGGYHRLLSWSPDEHYIAFVSEVAFGAQSHIFRLNIATGEIVNLTASLVPPLELQAYYAPAWGP